METVYVGVGGIGALFQLMYVYTFSALEKRTRAWDAWYKEGVEFFLERVC